MANLTKAQRYNKNLDRIFDTYNNHQNSLPPIELYTKYLHEAVSKLKISINEARNRYGLYTTQQWESLLNLSWNKQ